MPADTPTPPQADERLTSEELDRCESWLKAFPNANPNKKPMLRLIAHARLAPTAQEGDRGRAELRERIMREVAPRIAEDLEASIANLGYPVGMGQAPHPDACLLAARKIISRISDRALAALDHAADGRER